MNHTQLQQDLNTKQATIAVVGLGYVGLPLGIELSTRYHVKGFDISDDKINDLSNNQDTTGELSSETIQNSPMSFHSDPSILSSAQVIIVTVPTPIDSSKKPDLSALISATTLIGKHLQPGAIVVYESTVYPGTTEDICIPILEKESRLQVGKEFCVGYSPERLSPGDTNYTLTKIVKVVAGYTEQTCTLLADLYGSIIPAGIHQAPSIKVAEAAKVIENTQRDLNVALMNELAIIFNRMNICTLDVINAAATKWNFIRMTPGLVGGHCIGVDPYYLTYKAEELGYHPQVILAGRRINDNMGKYIGEQTVKHLIKADKPVKGARILVLGFTFKENVSDIRNTKVIDIIHELEDYGALITVYDPMANQEETQHEYNLSLKDIGNIDDYSAIILAVAHKKLQPVINAINTKLNQVIIDIKGILKNNPDITKGHYFSL